MWGGKWKTLRKSEEEIFEAKHRFLQLFQELIHTYEVKSTIWHTLILLIAISACSMRTSSFEQNEQNNNKNDLHSTSSAETNKEIKLTLISFPFLVNPSTPSIGEAIAMGLSGEKHPEVKPMGFTEEQKKRFAEYRKDIERVYGKGFYMNDKTTWPAWMKEQESNSWPVEKVQISGTNIILKKETQPKPAAEHEGTIPNIDEKNASKQEAASLSEADEEAERRRRLNMYFPIDVLATILTGRAPEYRKANKESPEEEKKRKERIEAWGREVKAKNLGPSYNKDLVIPGY